MDTDKIYTGILKTWKSDKGYGFITSDSGQDYFAHLYDFTYTFILPGDKVKFQLKDSTKRANSIVAVNIKRYEEK